MTLQSKNQQSSAVPKANIGGPVLLCASVLTVCGLLGPNFDLAALASASFALGTLLLWRRAEAPILLFVFLFQWLQATVAIYHATWAGETVEAFAPFQGQQRLAIMLTHLALCAMSIGMKGGAGGRHQLDLDRASLLVRSRPPLSWFKLYLAASLIGWVALFLAEHIPGLSQVLFGIARLRWAFYFMLVFATFIPGGRISSWFCIAFIAEFLLSFGGFFSDFKTVFIVSFLALILARVRFSLVTLTIGSLIAISVIYLGIVWTAIKPEYRAFVSGGESAQVITVDYETRMFKLVELIRNIDGTTFGNATEDLLKRLTYVEFFGLVLNTVPRLVPHANGAILADAFIRPFTPRILFPDKTVIDDSERTSLYSGRTVSGADQGTSISLGWVAEMYIDFGSALMMPLALVLGYFYGLIYRMFVTWHRSRGLLGAGTATAILLGATFLESSITKVVGGLLASSVGAWMVIRFAVPIFCLWLLETRS